MAGNAVAAAEQKRGIPEEGPQNRSFPIKGTRVGHGVDSVREIPEEHEQSRRVGSRKDTLL